MVGFMDKMIKKDLKITGRETEFQEKEAQQDENIVFWV